MDDAEVSFQTAELGKVDAGGGGTIAYIPAKYGMDVIDSGVAKLSMHAPWEVTSRPISSRRIADTAPSLRPRAETGNILLWGGSDTELWGDFGTEA